jgi:hypothetical protein
MKCDHHVVEQYIEQTPRRRRQRIIAICSGCSAVATRLWIVATGDRLGWIWPEQEEAYRAWRKRQGGRHG